MSFPPSDTDWLHDPLVPDAHKRALQRRYLYTPTPIESPLRFTTNCDKGDENVEKPKSDALLVLAAITKIIQQLEEERAELEKKLTNCYDFRTLWQQRQ